MRDEVDVPESEWMSLKQAADRLEVSERTVLRSLATAAEANRWWGETGWREKPLSRRRILQVRRSAVEALLAGGPLKQLAEPGDENTPPGGTPGGVVER